MDAGPGHKPTDAPAGLTGGGTWALAQSRFDQQRLREGAEPEGCLAPAPARAGTLARHAVGVRAGGGSSVRRGQVGLPGGPAA